VKNQEERATSFGSKREESHWQAGWNDVLSYARATIFPVGVSKNCSPVSVNSELISLRGYCSDFSSR
jgi:hypothetical protein